MDPLTLGLLMGGTALVSGYMADRQNKQINKMNQAQANAAAAQTQFSPWTKMGAGQFQPQMTKDVVGAGMQGALTGASFAQNYDAAQSQKSLADSQANYYRNQSQNPWIFNSKLKGNTHQMAGGYDGMMG